MLSKGKQEFGFKFYKIKVKGLYRIFVHFDKDDKQKIRCLLFPAVRNPGSDKFL